MILSNMKTYQLCQKYKGELQRKEFPKYLYNENNLKEKKEKEYKGKILKTTCFNIPLGCPCQTSKERIRKPQKNTI